jgi:hypothetical protein
MFQPAEAGCISIRVGGDGGTSIGIKKERAPPQHAFCKAQSDNYHNSLPAPEISTSDLSVARFVIMDMYYGMDPKS